MEITAATRSLPQRRGRFTTVMAFSSVVLAECQAEPAGERGNSGGDVLDLRETHRGNAIVPDCQTRTRRLTRAAAPRPNRGGATREQNRAVSPSEIDTTAIGRNRSTGFVFVLMHPHATAGIVVVENARSGSSVMPTLAAHSRASALKWSAAAEPAGHRSRCVGSPA